VSDQVALSLDTSGDNDMDFNSTLSHYFDQSGELSFSSSDIRQFQTQSNQMYPVTYDLWRANLLIDQAISGDDFGEEL
jgi:hypothetical protein